MQQRFRPVLALLLFVLPGALSAQVQATTVTLGVNQTLNLQTGAVGSSGGDIQFTGTAIAFLGAAKGISLTAIDSAFSGSTWFSNPPVADVEAYQSSFSSASIGAYLSEIIAYQTSAGNIGELLVDTVSTTSIILQFATFDTTVPGITAVLNNYGLVPPGFSNSGIAPGALFIIKGGNLSSIATAALQNPAAPGLPGTLGGSTVNVTVNGVTTHPAFYYAEASQLALVMPSNTPVGAGTVTVTWNGQTSNAYPINVVASNFGMLSADQTGSGWVKAVNPNNAANPYISFTNPAPPGEVISIYGSGLGADAARDAEFVMLNGAQINGLAAFYVGGIPVTIQYQGASGYPGLNQVNIQLPANVPTGCFVSVVGVTASGVPTNFLTMPIGNGACQDSGLGLTSSVISGLSGTNNVNLGSVLMTWEQTGNQTPVVAAIASFQSYPAASFNDNAALDLFYVEVAAFSDNGAFVTPGGCVASELVEGALYSGPEAVVAPTGLNAGGITVTSPNAGYSPTQVPYLLSPGEYGTIYDVINTGWLSNLPAGFLTQAGGTFPFTATAGTNVGAFSTQVPFPTPMLTWTNESAVTTVTRSRGVTVNWSGGQPGTNVFIQGTAATSTASGSFTCVAPVSAGTFTVPAYVLAALPATQIGLGALTVGNESVPLSFTATGLNWGYAAGYVAYMNYVTYQ